MGKQKRTVSGLIRETRRMVKSIPQISEKIAEHQPESPVTPKFETPAGQAMRKLAADLRDPTALEQTKLAAMGRVLNDDMPSMEEINSCEEKLAFDVAVEASMNESEKTRAVAEGLRKLASEVKTASHVEAFKKVRAVLAAENISRYIS